MIFGLPYLSGSLNIAIMNDHIDLFPLGHELVILLELFATQFVFDGYAFFREEVAEVTELAVDTRFEGRLLHHKHLPPPLILHHLLLLVLRELARFLLVDVVHYF